MKIEINKWEMELLIELLENAYTDFQDHDNELAKKAHKLGRKLSESTGLPTVLFQYYKKEVME